MQDDQIKVINFDLISADLSQEAHAAVRGFRILRAQEFFTAIDTKDYIVWADCGKHFRSKEMIGYLLCELADNDIHGIKIYRILKSFKKLIIFIFKKTSQSKFFGRKTW